MRVSSTNNRSVGRMVEQATKIFLTRCNEVEKHIQQFHPTYNCQVEVEDNATPAFRDTVGNERLDRCRDSSSVSELTLVTNEISGREDEKLLIAECVWLEKCIRDRILTLKAMAIDPENA